MVTARGWRRRELTVILLLLLLTYLFCFLGLHPCPLEDPRLGLSQSYGCRPTTQTQQCGIWATSATYTTAHSNTRSLTHWARPETEPVSSWILVRFVSTAPQWELQKLIPQCRAPPISLFMMPPILNQQLLPSIFLTMYSFFLVVPKYLLKTCYFPGTALCVYWML